ncbi:hypothetical protein [Intestinibaculum porci]|jgi:Na+-driven multidrug efflux pump|uniref:hypothetical protein n=1 Tax=Intestinibaculum porci TaxID=2487118 RepID=UPI000EE32F14|nr:hypothetical protein [Intestinibaculum porci]MDD6348490.1 hypothetical protein [Intestinibaculum porci]HAN57879.1 hypothetical protein [Erysipelotrichaceae bacterium]
MKKVDFKNGNITQNILRTAFPMLIAQILNLLYSIVDSVYTLDQINEALAHVRSGHSKGKTIIRMD